VQRPVIAICSAVESARWGAWDQTAALVPINYVGAVQLAGGLVLVLPPDEDVVGDAGQVLDLCDGLMLAGGVDIDPASYDHPAHPQTVDTVPDRDAFEIALTRGAVERDMPVLGICRGMQLINVALGGTLSQHLPERVGHSEHRRVEGSFNGSDHEVHLVAGTLAAAVVGSSPHNTKSHHHQGVDRLGNGLVRSGTSPLDGLAEAIELPGRHFVLGVQWHPEADEESPVIGALVAAAKNYAEDRPARS
jgi:putative glutamine amidotransferase